MTVHALHPEDFDPPSPLAQELGTLIHEAILESEAFARRDLVLTAIRLWPADRYLQDEWLRAIRVVRTTRRGWLLERRL